MSDDIDLSRLSQEADRLLTGLSDAGSAPQKTSESGRPATPQNDLQLSESCSDRNMITGIDESNNKSTLFLLAVSELKRKGILKSGGPIPSLEQSRTTTLSYVLCDKQNQVIGRVPLASLYSRGAQGALTTPSPRMTASPSPSRSTTQQAKISPNSLDNESLLLFGQLLPEEQKSFITQYNLAKKSVSMGVLLALFLGGLGIHKFWLGSIGTGIVYLAFCWTFIPTLVAIIDACLMSSSVQQYNTKVAREAYWRIVSRR